MTQHTRKFSSLLVASVLVMGSVLAQPAQAQVAVPVPQAELDAALASCTSAEACLAAIEVLMAQLVAANPGVDIATILGSVVAAVSAAYNAGTLPAEVATVALESTASVATSSGSPQIAAAITVAVASVASGNAIDLEAIAEASGSPT